MGVLWLTIIIILRLAFFSCFAMPIWRLRHVRDEPSEYNRCNDRMEIFTLLPVFIPHVGYEPTMMVFKKHPRRNRLVFLREIIKKSIQKQLLTNTNYKDRRISLSMQIRLLFAN